MDIKELIAKCTRLAELSKDNPEVQETIQLMMDIFYKQPAKEYMPVPYIPCIPANPYPYWQLFTITINSDAPQVIGGYH